MKAFFLLIFFISSLFSLTLEESKHLLNRTSFGYTKAQLEFFSKLSKAEAVDFLISTVEHKEIHSLPKNIKEVSVLNNVDFKSLDKKQKKELRQNRNKKMQEIKVWWYKMMMDSKYSFREKMTLFWHNHFVSEYKVVKSPYMMYKQNELFRQYALGSFDELLHKSSKDLAMLIYLDNNSNKKSNPNENYARELLELFTLGEGNYSEEDIKEAARSFTGLRINRKNVKFKFVKKQHDFGEKTFLGQKGQFSSEDIINIILRQEQTAIFISEKLYKEFISKNINEEEVRLFANKFRASNYDLSVLMKEILLSDSFWNSKNSMIKSPSELIVSLVKAFEFDLKTKEFRFIIKSAKNLGQDLFNPPSVQGWIGGKQWIDSTSLVLRKEFITKALNRKINKRTIKKFDFNDIKELEEYVLNKQSNSEEKKINKNSYISILTDLSFQLK